MGDTPTPGFELLVINVMVLLVHLSILVYGCIF